MILKELIMFLQLLILVIVVEVKPFTCLSVHWGLYRDRYLFHGEYNCKMFLTILLEKWNISFTIIISWPSHMKVVNWFIHMINICFKIPKFMSMWRQVINLGLNFTYIIWWWQLNSRASLRKQSAAFSS